ITDAEAMLRAGMLQFRERLGEYIYSEDGSSMAETVVGQLMDAGVKVAVAESCTGGLLASMITEVNGSSIVFEYGLSAYADWVKRASLSVNNGILQKYTAISSATAAEMAKGARTNGHSQIGVGITGIAGPTSGDYVGKPVGLVYIAVCDKTNVVVKKFNFGNLRGRTAVQELSAKNALDMIRRFLAGIEIPDSKGFANNIIADIEKDGKASKINSIAIKKGITSVLAVSLLITCGVLVGAKVLRQKSTDNYNNVGAEFLASSSGGQFIQQGLRDLKEQNADTEAWIRVGAGTENVVVRDKGDGYYEKHDFYGSESPFGCPYIKQGLDDIANTDNIILYACIDEGTAFADLRKLIADQEYISANREITLTTLYDETKYKIVSVYYANTDEASGAVDSGFEFSDFKNGDGFINYVVDFKMRSLWNYDVDIVSGDRFVTIVSDLPDWKGAKLVIVARAVRDGELDNQNQLMPQKNFSALYPKKWYDVNKASPVLNETVEKDKWYNWFIANEKSIKFVQDAHNTGGVIDFTRGYESAVGNDGQVVITVYINGQRMTDTPLNIVSMIVMSETGGTFTEEATKAQAVATVSLLKYELQSAEVPHFEGNTPTEEVKKLVEQVINEGMFYDGKIIYAPYFEISAGPTCSALDFWGIEYPYLQSVESPYDYQVYGYTRNTSYPLEAIRARIESYFDIKLSSNQSNWMKIIDYTASGYVKNVNVDDQIVSTGAELYEKVLGIRSSNFAMTWYESSANVLTTGYGHCVGMSKEGADLYAINKGWNYHEILSHYYTGVSFGAVEW
ncbi:MAG: nicotinamide-nucleotide amidohydrolase family protein, partial [Oscillospiraceae bacterium]